MCGIFGYIGSQDPVKACIQGLKFLEYRGYDSSGIAGVYKNNLISFKEVGKIRELENATQFLEHRLENAISHTRWATHGRATKSNAHPQFDQHDRIAVVHNGIIANYSELRKILLEKGVVFRSETDTEVISQLVSFYYSGDILEAFSRALADLKGFWAIALIHKDHPETILVSSRENPIAIGIDQNSGEAYISSDVNAFYTADLEICFLKNDEIAAVSHSGVRVFNNRFEPISKTMQRFSLQNHILSKNGYDHFMIKEIFEQPDTIRQALHGRICEEIGTALFPDLSFSQEDLRGVQQVLILACGTSWHAGLIAASWIEEKVGIPARAEIASEFRYKTSVLQDDTLVVAISQSGETFDTIAAVREIKARGAKILAVCNVPNSTLTRDADGCIFLKAGPEISVCSTKAFTAQLTVLSLFTLLMARLKGTMSLAEGQIFLEHLQMLPIQIDWILRKRDAIKALAHKYAHFNNFFFLGRHYMYPTSLEGALKLKEISYINASGYPAGEMKHGPIALVDPSLAVVGLCGHEKTLDKMLSNLMEIQAREAPILAFANEGTPEISQLANDVFFLPKTSDEFSCFLYSVAAQLLAYHIALERGTEIDQPRNLAKSVTVE